MSARAERDKTGITYIQQICDVCGKSRNTRKRHLRCSRIRQLRYQGANHG